MKEPIKQYKPAEKLELPKIKKEFPKVFRKVTCPSCSQDVGADHINLEKSLAKCGSCAVIFSIEEEVASLKLQEKVKQEIFRPEGVDLFYYKGDMEIALPQPIHWIDMSGALFLPIIALFSFLPYSSGSIPVFIPLLLMASALFFIYRAIKYRKAKTYIDVTERSLTIKHRPSNFKKDIAFSAEDIDQIYLKHSHIHSGYFVLNMIVNGPKGQQHQELVHVSSISKAKYLEQEIEKYLGIEDRKVPEATA